jgi:hypothetical protein
MLWYVTLLNLKRSPIRKLVFGEIINMDKIDIHKIHIEK